MTIEIERVVAVEEVITPYFWVSDAELSAFEGAAGDPSVDNSVGSTSSTTPPSTAWTGRRTSSPSPTPTTRWTPRS